MNRSIFLFIVMSTGNNIIAQDLNKRIDSIVAHLPYFYVTDFGAVDDSITDCTDAIQTTIQKAYDVGGGVVYFPCKTKGKYLVSGTIKTSDGNGHKVNNAQLYIPHTGYINIQNAPTIILKSDIPPVPYSDWTTNQNEDVTGVWIISTTSDDGCVLGSAYSSGTWGNWNYTQAFIQNLGIQTKSVDNGIDVANTMSAVDFYYNTMNGGHDVKFKTQSFPGRSVQPKAGCYGLRLPANNNFNATNWQNVFVQGFATGVQVSENAHIINLNINTCDTGLNIIAGFHALQIERAIVQWTRTNVLISGTSYFNILQLDIESYMGSSIPGLTDKWFNNISDIKEKYLTNSRGNIKYHYVRSYNPNINEYNINNSILSPTIKVSPIGTDGSVGNNGYVQLRYDSGFYSTSNLYFDRTFSKVGIQNTSPSSTITISLPNAGVGAISHDAGGTIVTGVGTDFLNTFDIGDNIADAGQSRAITAISSNTSMTTTAWTNAASNASYSYVKADNLQLRSSGSIFTAGNKRLLYYKLFNAAFGVDAMHSVTTGNRNAALGYNALYSLTTGVNNVGIGYKAGYATTIGTGNNFIGYNAGGANTTGTNNIAIGQSAFSTNITGSNNVAVGYGALNLNTVSNMTAVGHFALANNSTGVENSSLGYQSLKANTTGSRNTALGMSALINNTTGNDNVAIGRTALWNNTTGNNNIAIGSRADNSGANQSNSITIGYGIISSASNTTTIGNTSTIMTYFPGGGINLQKSVAPIPATGQAVLWFDGTNIKITKNILGETTTGIIF